MLYSFEEQTVPTEWRTGGEGELSVSSRHAKHGSQSLRWDWTGGARLWVTDPSGLTEAAAARHGGIRVWVYNEKALDAQLRFRFGGEAALRADAPRFRFSFGLNFAGWRAVWVDFHDDAATEPGTADDAVDTMEVLAPEPPGEGTVYLDLVEFTQAIPWTRTPDCQLPFLNAERLASGEHVWLKTYAVSRNELPAAPERITEAERSAFARIAKRYEDWVFGNAPDRSQEPIRLRWDARKHYVDLGKRAFADLGIERRDGLLRGTPLFASRSPHRPKFVDVHQRVILPLALDWRLNGNEESRDNFLLLIDHLHDQGWAHGSGLGTMDHETLRAAGYMHAVYLMRDELQKAGRLDRELATMDWYTDFGEVYQEPKHPGTSADVMRTTMLHRLLRVLAMGDSPEKVAAMRCLVRWMNSACSLAPGWADTIKPDYTGFHHRGIYANAYAPHGFHNAALVCYLLHDTPFALSEQSRQNLRQALLTARLTANKYDCPTTVSGRMPFSANILARIMPGFAYLALTADPLDRVMASAFMRLWDPASPQLRDELFPKAAAGIMYLDTLGALELMQNLANRDLPAEPDPEGHWTKPYGALALHRRDDWLVSVKGWSRYVWNYEGHADENVFGRYLSFGTMQIFAGGEPITQAGSGYVSAGWDWNRWPGATTIRLPLAELGKDAKENARHFSDETFVGGVSSQGRNGVFAMKLHDTVHDPSFRARKSVFCFDDVLVCLGSDIENGDGEHPTETTLFQCHLPDSSTPLGVDAAEVTALPFARQFAPGEAALLTDPAGNSYYVPNAEGLHVVRQHQASIDDNGRDETEGDFAVAWIDHGTQPESASYEYAVLVQADPARVAELAKTPPYQVLRKDTHAHVVRHTKLSLTGYAVFEAGAVGVDGIQQVDTPCLLMVQKDEKGMTLSVSDPDLRLCDQWLPDLGAIRAEHLYGESKPSTVLVTLKGNWALADDVLAARLVGRTADTTTVAFQCSHGRTVEVALASPAPRPVTNESQSEPRP